MEKHLSMHKTGKQTEKTEDEKKSVMDVFMKDIMCWSFVYLIIPFFDESKGIHEVGNHTMENRNNKDHAKACRCNRDLNSLLHRCIAQEPVLSQQCKRFDIFWNQFQSLLINYLFTFRFKFPDITDQQLLREFNYLLLLTLVIEDIKEETSSDNKRCCYFTKKDDSIKTIVCTLSDMHRRQFMDTIASSSVLDEHPQLNKMVSQKTLTYPLSLSLTKILYAIMLVVTYTRTLDTMCLEKFIDIADLSTNMKKITPTHVKDVILPAFEKEFTGQEMIAKKMRNIYVGMAVIKRLFSKEDTQKLDALAQNLYFS